MIFITFNVYRNEILFNAPTGTGDLVKVGYYDGQNQFIVKNFADEYVIKPE